MSDKIVIVKDNRIFAWFKKGQILPGNEPNTVVLREEEAVLNAAQKHSMDNYKVMGDIQLTIKPDRVEIFSRTNIIRNGDTTMSQDGDTTIFSDGHQTRVRSAYRFIKTDKGIKSIKMKFRHEPEFVPVLVLSTVAAKQHGHLTKLSHIRNPANAIKRYIRNEASRLLSEGALAASEDMFKYEFIREMWFEDGVLQVLEYNVSDPGILNGVPVVQDNEQVEYA